MNRKVQDAALGEFETQKSDGHVHSLIHSYDEGDMEPKLVETHSPAIEKRTTLKEKPWARMKCQKINGRGNVMRCDDRLIVFAAVDAVRW